MIQMGICCLRVFTFHLHPEYLYKVAGGSLVSIMSSCSSLENQTETSYNSSSESSSDKGQVSSDHGFGSVDKGMTVWYTVHLMGAVLGNRWIQSQILEKIEVSLLKWIHLQ